MYKTVSAAHRANERELLWVVIKPSLCSGKGIHFGSGKSWRKALVVRLPVEFFSTSKPTLAGTRAMKDRPLWC